VVRTGVCATSEEVLGDVVPDTNVGVATDPELRKMLIAMQRGGSVEEVAATVFFLTARARPTSAATSSASTAAGSLAGTDPRPSPSSADGNAEGATVTSSHIIAGLTEQLRELVSPRRLRPHQRVPHRERLLRDSLLMPIGEGTNEMLA
jgi:hypothetical protein